MASTATSLETSGYCHNRLSTTPIPLHSSVVRPTSTLSIFETLPVEIVDQILSYLVHPRCRLPGLTEAQSAHTVPEKLKRSIKDQEDLTQPPDGDRWATDIFSLHLFSHPFNALAKTSRRCHAHVEDYCSHLVRACNGTMFNLPFAQLDKYGFKCVYPDMSSIVYRRLWLQHAPRRCVYCYAVLDCYPFSKVNRVITACKGCFYRQALTIDEVSRQYHVSAETILASKHIRGNSSAIWVLRIDVEALALQLYRTRAFHEARKEQLGRPCSICAITRFTTRHIAKKRAPKRLARS
ncbi:hypothetical protein GMOD_00002778 [Pyrenophora seminiperda CCB06]|uniref:Uncharacterized protein n=1 Tax=Pyrenophora seminiperda CCB06 TaxID=1302712 RepID=A0A3M7M392_9PLEO|nr:hypothetical protein GMOD_00002778 [Pyrenophora seminiperda CCB06]